MFGERCGLDLMGDPSTTDSIHAFAFGTHDNIVMYYLSLVSSFFRIHGTGARERMCLHPFRHAQVVHSEGFLPCVPWTTLQV
jgi:hypothetical protein